MESNKPVKHIDDMLVVQHDWHLSLKDAISKFFIGVKRVGAGKSDYFDVQVTKLIDEFSFTVLPEEGAVKATEFAVSLDKNKHLHVTYQGKTTIFVSPTKEQTVDGFESAPHSIDLSVTTATFVAADASGNLAVHDSKYNKTVRSLTGHVMDIYRCLYFPSGLVVLAAGMDMSIRIWPVDTGICVRTLKGHTQAITGLGIFAEGKRIVSCSNDGTARVWNCGSGETTECFVFEAGKCVDVAAAKDGQRFAVICERNLLSVVNFNATRTRHDIRLPGEPSAICFSDDQAGEVAFVGFKDGHVAAYSTVDPRLIGEVHSNKGSVTCVKHKGTRLLVSFNSGSVTSYQVPTLASLAAGDGSSVLDGIRAEFELTGPDCDPVYDMSVEGNIVATCCRDHKVRLYEFKTDK